MRLRFSGCAILDNEYDGNKYCDDGNCWWDRGP